MAKGDPSGVYVPEPQADLLSLEETISWIKRELQQVSDATAFGLVRNVEFLNVAPDKPREGMIRGADGTNWNPGSGIGVYVYYSSAWHLLG